MLFFSLSSIARQYHTCGELLYSTVEFSVFAAPGVLLTSGKIYRLYRLPVGKYGFSRLGRPEIFVQDPLSGMEFYNVP